MDSHGGRDRERERGRGGDDEVVSGVNRLAAVLPAERERAARRRGVVPGRAPRPEPSFLERLLRSLCCCCGGGSAADADPSVTIRNALEKFAEGGGSGGGGGGGYSVASSTSSSGGEGSRSSSAAGGGSRGGDRERGLGAYASSRPSRADRGGGAGGGGSGGDRGDSVPHLQLQQQQGQQLGLGPLSPSQAAAAAAAQQDPRERDLLSVGLWHQRSDNSLGSDGGDNSSLSRSGSFRIHEPGRALSVISEATAETSRSGFTSVYDRSQSRLMLMGGPHNSEGSRASTPRSGPSWQRGHGGSMSMGPDYAYGAGGGSSGGGSNSGVVLVVGRTGGSGGGGGGTRGSGGRAGSTASAGSYSAYDGGGSLSARVSGLTLRHQPAVLSSQAPHSYGGGGGGSGGSAFSTPDRPGGGRGGGGGSGALMYRDAGTGTGIHTVDDLSVSIVSPLAPSGGASGSGYRVISGPAGAGGGSRQQPGSGGGGGSRAFGLASYGSGSDNILHSVSGVHTFDSSDDDAPVGGSGSSGRPSPAMSPSPSLLVEAAAASRGGGSGGSAAAAERARSAGSKLDAGSDDDDGDDDDRLPEMPAAAAASKLSARSSGSGSAGGAVVPPLQLQPLQPATGGS